MQFSKKIFLSVFFSSVLLGSIINWSAQRVVMSRARDNFTERYSTLNRTIGRNLTNLEVKTEILMKNAALAIAREDALAGPLSTAKLKSLRDQFQVSHVFATDLQGKFIRSTNEAPSQIPNLFGFCSRYKELATGESSALGTPIIPPQPEPKPYKFLTVPNSNRTRLIEVGVRVDFLADTLVSAMKDDPTIARMSLYAPNGAPLGAFDQKGMLDGQSSPLKLDRVALGSVESSQDMTLYTRLESSQPNCCQCDTAGLSENGLYYYVLETVVSKRELAATLASINKFFLALQAIALVTSLALAIWISHALGSRVRQLAQKVRMTGTDKTPEGGLALGGKDEISFLGREFDHLLARMQAAQASAIQNEKALAISELAKEVSHNMRSPIYSLERIIPRVSGIPETDRSVLRLAVREIKDHCIRLRNRALDRQASEQSAEQSGEQSEGATFVPGLTRTSRRTVQHLSCLIDQAIVEKRAQFSGASKVEIVAPNAMDGYGIFASIEPISFRTILSNLIINAAEALPTSGGQIAVLIKSEAGRVFVTVKDNGQGIPPEHFDHLGEAGYTFGKPDGTGRGLHHAKATIESWGGALSVDSKENLGTAVTLELPLAEPPLWFVQAIEIEPASILVIADDEELVHLTWDLRLGREAAIQTNGVEVVHLKSPSELREWVTQNAGRISRTRFFVDYEFIGDSKNGLAIIEELRIGARSTLVTGRFDESGIIDRANWLQVKILPKPLVSTISIFCPPIPARVYVAAN